jgi:hypothetical protein
VRRPDGAPFIRHPGEVAALLHDAGAPESVVAAGLLHDVVEKTDATLEEIEERFGPEVARLVAAVTEDESIDGYERRKAALIESAIAGGPDAAALFAADKVSKVRDFRARLVREDGEDLPEPNKLAHYRQSLEALEKAIPGHPLVERLRGELDEVEGVRAGDRGAQERAHAAHDPDAA